MVQGEAGRAVAALTGRILLVDSLDLRGHCSTGFLGSITMLADPKAEQVLSEMPCCLQSYRKAVSTARRDKKAGRTQGLTEEQKQEIR